MGKGRTEGVVALPKGIHAVTKPHGRTLYYWAPKRGTASAGPPIRLPDDPASPEFWRALGELQIARRGPQAGTFSALIKEYLASPEFARLSPATRRDYTRYLDLIEKWWGSLAVAGVRPKHVLAQRDTMAETPASANHMLSVLRTVIRWGIPREYRNDDPTIGVPKLRNRRRGRSPVAGGNLRSCAEGRAAGYPPCGDPGARHRPAHQRPVPNAARG